MKQQNERPLYANLQYDVLHKLEVSINEYFYLDMVHKLSYQRWCTKSLENCASDMNISKRGLIKLRDRLVERGLIQKNLRGGLKVTDKYTGVAVNKVHFGGELSGTKNNKEINIDNRGLKSGAKERIRQARLTKSWGSLK